MTQALLYQKLPGNKVRCQVCQHLCLISEDQWGYCQTRVNKKGKLYSAVDKIASAVNNDPIEKKPVFHYQPGSFCFSLGTFGCNFRCKFCQNWEIAWANGKEKASLGTKIPPQKAVDLTKKAGSAGIAITYNEPTIWLEYSLKVFKLAKKANLYTVWVTNGYATRQTIDLIAPYLDVYRVDLKSFNDHFYQKLIGIPKAAGIFEMTKYVHDQHPKIHLEGITNLIPTWNDSEKDLKQMANWIRKNLGPKTPWHVTRFFPYAKLTSVKPTPPETLFKARKIGQKAGLEFVYIGNLAVDKEDDTFCPKCGQLAIRRNGYSIEVLGVSKKGKCSKCGEDLNIILQ